MEKFLKNIFSNENKTNSKKKIENLVFFIFILIITILLMNNIWNGKKEKLNIEENNKTKTEVLAQNVEMKNELEEKLENILSTIKNVGKVKVFINYQETNSIIPLYDETITTSSTVEGDSDGGTRNTTETQNQKEIVFSETSGNKQPVTQKSVMPVIQGAIVTAEGANDANVKTNIINAVQAATGVSMDKIQVFEMK
jgi:stage III sporulation protein AG